MRPATCSGRRRRQPRPRTRSNRSPVAPIIVGSYDLGMPSARLTIIVHLDQAASLDRMEEFGEQRRTPTGTDVSVLLSAADPPAATRLFGDLGTLAIPFEATATIGDTRYLVAGDGNQVSVVEEWTAATPGGLADPPRRTDRSVDGNRQRQYEWHCGFVDRVTEPTATGPSPAPTVRSAWFGRFGGLSAHLSSTVAEVRNEPRRSRQVLRYSAVT